MTGHEHTETLRAHIEVCRDLGRDALRTAARRDGLSFAVEVEDALDIFDRQIDNILGRANAGSSSVETRQEQSHGGEGLRDTWLITVPVEVTPDAEMDNLVAGIVGLLESLDETVVYRGGAMVQNISVLTDDEADEILHDARRRAREI